MVFLFNIERDFKKHFLQLLNKRKKDDFFNVISDEDETLFELPESEMYDEILNTLGLTLEEAIYNILHYNLEIFLEVRNDEIGNTLVYKLALGKLINNSFSGVILFVNDNGDYELNYIGENSIINDENEFVQEERLKQYIGEENYKNIFILMEDILMYDEKVGTYVGVNKEFEELFSNKVIYLKLNDTNRLIYINSTLSETDIEIYE